MGISDADPAGGAQDSVEVQALKARIAELETRKADPVPAPEPEGGPAAEAPVQAPASDEPSPEVQALQKQLADQRQKIEELTTQALAQKDPATADASVDVKSLLNQLVAAQADYRQEITALRVELAKVRRTPIPTSTVRALSAQELLAIRLAQIDSASHYCPACGALYGRPRECTGKAASPHPAVEVVETGELKDPPDSTDKAAVEAYQAGHTVMQYVDPDINSQLLG